MNEMAAFFPKGDILKKYQRTRKNMKQNVDMLLHNVKKEKSTDASLCVVPYVGNEVELHNKSSKMASAEDTDKDAVDLKWHQISKELKKSSIYEGKCDLSAGTLKIVNKKRSLLHSNSVSSRKRRMASVVSNDCALPDKEFDTGETWPFTLKRKKSDARSPRSSTSVKLPSMLELAKMFSQKGKSSQMSQVVIKEVLSSDEKDVQTKCMESEDEDLDFLSPQRKADVKWRPNTSQRVVEAMSSEDESSKPTLSKVGNEKFVLLPKRCPRLPKHRYQNDDFQRTKCNESHAEMLGVTLRAGRKILDPLATSNRARRCYKRRPKVEVPNALPSSLATSKVTTFLEPPANTSSPYIVNFPQGPSDVILRNSTSIRADVHQQLHPCAHPALLVIPLCTCRRGHANLEHLKSTACIPLTAPGGFNHIDAVKQKKHFPLTSYELPASPSSSASSSDNLFNVSTPKKYAQALTDILETNGRDSNWITPIVPSHRSESVFQPKIIKVESHAPISNMESSFGAPKQTSNCVRNVSPGSFEKIKHSPKKLFQSTQLHCDMPPPTKFPDFFINFFENMDNYDCLFQATSSNQRAQQLLGHELTVEEFCELPGPVILRQNLRVLKHNNRKRGYTFPLNFKEMPLSSVRKDCLAFHLKKLFPSDKDISKCLSTSMLFKKTRYMQTYEKAILPLENPGEAILDKVEIISRLTAVAILNILLKYNSEAL